MNKCYLHFLKHYRFLQVHTSHNALQRIHLRTNKQRELKNFKLKPLIVFGT